MSYTRNNSCHYSGSEGKSQPLNFRKTEKFSDSR